MKNVENIITQLRIATNGMVEPASRLITKEFGLNPFLQLIACILSLRTKDTVSFPASRRLFSAYKTPQEMVRASLQELQTLIYPVGFYRRKSDQILKICKILIEQFDGKVPCDEKSLLSFSGVGRKTMNLVLAEGFCVPAICVDVHVHRISNRLGLVNTLKPEHTEIALKKILPQKYWREYSYLIVMWGQNICVPVSPFCSKCPIRTFCDRVGVKKSR